MRDDINSENEKRFEALAKAYADFESEALKKELVELENAILEKELVELENAVFEKELTDPENAASGASLIKIDKRGEIARFSASGLDAKIRKKIWRERFRSYRFALIPLAAAAAILMFALNINWSGARIPGAWSRPSASAPAPSAPAPSTPAPSASAPSASAPASPAPAPAAPSAQSSSTPSQAPSSSAPSQAPSSSAPSRPSPADSLPGAPSAALLELQDSVRLVSATLPEGYTVQNVDYDNLAAIMEISNARQNRIVLAIEEYSGFESEGFSVIAINGATVYGLVKNDYSVLKYSVDNLLFTLSSRFDYEDLIEISENII